MNNCKAQSKSTQDIVRVTHTRHQASTCHLAACHLSIMQSKWINASTKVRPKETNMCQVCCHKIKSASDVMIHDSLIHTFWSSQNELQINTLLQVWPSLSEFCSAWCCWSTCSSAAPWPAAAPGPRSSRRSRACTTTTSTASTTTRPTPTPGPTSTATSCAAATARSAPTGPRTGSPDTSSRQCVFRLIWSLYQLTSI